MNIKHYNLKGTMVVVGFVTALTCTGALSNPARAAGLEPEVVSSTWEEGEQEYAAVSINGGEVLTYKGRTTCGSAETRAQSLAEKLEGILKDNADLVEALLPGREGCFATLKANGRTLLKFEPPTPVSDNDDGARVALKSSLQVINALRMALGTNKLPDAPVKFAEASTTGRLIALEGVDGFSGPASWYGPGFHGRKTSNGERFDQESMTAAHRTLPFGTKLLVTNRNTGKSCVVKVNDRGPYCDNRVIDLSHGAAKQLNMVSSGVAMVDVFVLQ